VRKPRFHSLHPIKALTREGDPSRPPYIQHRETFTPEYECTYDTRNFSPAEHFAFKIYRIRTNIGEELNLANWRIAKFKYHHFFYSISIPDFAKLISRQIHYFILTNRQIYPPIFVLIRYYLHDNYSYVAISSLYRSYRNPDYA